MCTYTRYEIARITVLGASQFTPTRSSVILCGICGGLHLSRFSWGPIIYPTYLSCLSETSEIFQTVVVVVVVVGGKTVFPQHLVGKMSKGALVLLTSNIPVD